MIGQGHHVALFGEAGQQRIGRGALGAALAGKQFHHGLGARPHAFGAGRMHQDSKLDKAESGAKEGSDRHGQGCKPVQRSAASQKRVRAEDLAHRRRHPPAV